MNPDVSAMWSQFTGATARAVAGAQGTTGAGSPLFAELQSIQNAMTDTRTRLYQSNIEKYYADQKAKNFLYKAPEDLLKQLIAGAELFKEKKMIERERGGTRF